MMQQNGMKCMCVIQLRIVVISWNGSNLLKISNSERLSCKKYWRIYYSYFFNASCYALRVGKK